MARETPLSFWAKTGNSTYPFELINAFTNSDNLTLSILWKSKTYCNDI